MTTICRRIAARGGNRFAAPLTNRFDELDGIMWLDNVFVPWERVFLVEPSPEPIATWLLWHHLYGWLAKAEFTLGLALALAHAMGLQEHPQTVEYIVDLVAEVQTARSCLTAAERDPAFTVGGLCHASYAHLMPGGIAMMKARQRISEILRIIPGSSLVVAPCDSDLAAPELAAELEETFGGGGYTAAQRAALLQLAADHVSSALDGRESAFELHASGGVPVWRGRLRRAFPSYNELANAVLRAIDLPMPEIDVERIPAAPLAPRRINAPAGSDGRGGLRGSSRARLRLFPRLGDRRRPRRHHVGDAVIEPVLAAQHEVRAGELRRPDRVLDECRRRAAPSAGRAPARAGGGRSRCRSRR